VRQQLIALNEIQKIDLEIREVMKSRDAIPKQLNELEGRIQQHTEQLQATTTELDALVAEIHNLEQTVHAENDKIRKWERRLNDIRNQREYQALSREIEGTRRAVREHEEQTIELMAQKEGLETKIEGLQDTLAVDAVDGDAERKRVESEVAELDKTIATMTARRDELGPEVKGSLLRKYENIRAKRLGVGLVPAVGGSCSGCNMRLPPQLYNILQRVDSIETCPSCQRILVYQPVLEEDGTSESAAQAPA